MTTPDAMRRVVVADDEALARERVRQLLARHPAWSIVAECRNGPETIEAILSHQPDVVFLDIGLPDLNGYAVARRLRAQEKELSRKPTLLVALTGWGSEDDKKKSLEAGFDLHLTKPVDARMVEGLLQRA